MRPPHDLQQRSVKIQSLTENIDTDTSTGRLMFSFLLGCEYSSI
ncbi:hypothetical protein [Mesorhizobium sp.]|nr:hypothetical protein [Mesorhizobium sp.]